MPQTIGQGKEQRAVRETNKSAVVATDSLVGIRASKQSDFAAMKDRLIKFTCPDTGPLSQAHIKIHLIGELIGVGEAKSKGFGGRVAALQSGSGIFDAKAAIGSDNLNAKRAAAGDWS